MEQRALLSVAPDVSWDGNTDGDGGDGSSWDDPYNWSTDQVPGEGENVLIDMAGASVRYDSTGPAINSLVCTEDLTVSGSSTLAAAGAIEINGTLTVYSGSAISASTLTTTGTSDLSQATINADVVNRGLLLVRSQTTTINGTLTNAEVGTVRVEGRDTSTALWRNATLSVASGVDNAGTIELASIDSFGSGAPVVTLAVGSGTLTNTGTIDVSFATSVGVPRILAELDNQHEVNLQFGTTLEKLGAHHVNSGTINVNGVRLDAPDFTSFTNSGTIDAGTGGLDFSDFGAFENTGAGVIDVGGGAFDLTSFTTLDNSGSITVGAGRRINVSGGRVINQSGATFGGDGELRFTGSSELQISGAYSPGNALLDLVDSTVTGAGSLTNNSTLRLERATLNVDVTNNGQMDVFSASSTIGGILNNAAGATLKLEGWRGGSSSMPEAKLIAASGISNAGAIQMTSRLIGSGYLATPIATLVVDSGALVNESTGVIDVLVGEYAGVRTISAELRNHGSVNVDWNVSLGKPGAHHVNSGTIAAANGVLSVVDSNVLENASGGAIELTSGNVSLSSGTALSNDGAITIPSGRTFTVGGDYTQLADGALDVEVEKLPGGPASSGKLAVSGVTQLDGALNVSLVEGSEFTLGDSFQVMTYGSTTPVAITGSSVDPIAIDEGDPVLLDGTFTLGGFATVTAPEFDGLRLFPVYSDTDLTLEAQSLPGSVPEAPTVHVEWGDGLDDTFTPDPGALSFSIPHTYDDDPPGSQSEYTITVTLSSASGSDTGSTTVTVNSVAPSATLSNDGPVDEGGTAVVTFSGQSDPSTADTAAGFTYDYDFGNDGTFEITGSILASVEVPAALLDDGPGGLTVGARIVDKDGGATDLTTTITVNNVAPAATLSNDGPVDEAGTAVVTFSGQSDPSTADTAAGFTYDYDFGDDGTFEITGSSLASVEVPAALLDDGPGSLAVGARIVDKDGGATDLATTITINNAAPSATLSNDGPVDEGGTAVVTFSEQSDPSTADTAAGFTYDYDFGDDGTFEITGSSLASVEVPAALLDDGPGGLAVGARIVDKDGGATDLTTTITVNNVAPTADLAGPSEGVRGQTLSYSANITDPGVLDTHTTEWEVVDGSSVVVAAGSGTELSFTPTVADTFTVAFTATDNDGGSGTDSIVVTVDALLVRDDPFDPGSTVLLVGGTAGGEKIILKPGAQPGSVRVKIDDIAIGEFPEIDRLVVFGQDGDDKIKVRVALGAISAELYGGPGNDRLRGGLGDDVIVGGPGDDLIGGKYGRDFLIAGDGFDKVIGHEDDDILIGGSYLYQTSREANRAVMAEWTRTDFDYAARVDHLMSGGGLNGDFVLNDSTVSDDGLRDRLKGKAGLDWFLAGRDDDKTDAGLDEILTDVEYGFMMLL